MSSVFKVECAAMKLALKALLIYFVMLTLLWPAFENGPDDDAALPPLPVEAAVVGGGGIGSFCRSEEFARALEARAFRWAYRAGSRPPVWNAGLTVLCDDEGAQIRVTVLSGKAPVYSTTYRRLGGVEGDEATARVIAGLLPLRGEVADAALAAYMKNQRDVARAGADLWRAKRYGQAVETLSAALDDDWDEAARAQLHYGLADSYAHLGKPRQAFWHALAYLSLSSREPDPAWIRSLRGAAGLLASQPANAEPEAEGLVRRWRQDAARKRWDLAAEDLTKLCLAAPWADRYADAAAELYGQLGWTASRKSWRRRAELARRIAGDAKLQERLAGLTR